MQARTQVASLRLPAGPRAAIKRTADCLANVDDRVAWVEKARTEAIIGGCLGSIDSVKSGIRCYLAFATDILKKERRLPPSVDDLLAWSIMFRCKDTFPTTSVTSELGVCLKVCQSLRLATPPSGVQSGQLQLVVSFGRVKSFSSGPK